MYRVLFKDCHSILGVLLFIVEIVAATLCGSGVIVVFVMRNLDSFYLFPTMMAFEFMPDSGPDHCSVACGHCVWHSAVGLSDLGHPEHAMPTLIDNAGHGIININIDT